VDHGTIFQVAEVTLAEVHQAEASTASAVEVLAEAAQEVHGKLNQINPKSWGEEMVFLFCASKKDQY
jgi:hypothetical protein